MRDKHTNRKIYAIYFLISIIFLIKFIGFINNLYVEIPVFIIGIFFLFVFFKNYLENNVIIS